MNSGPAAHACALVCVCISLQLFQSCGNMITAHLSFSHFSAHVYLNNFMICLNVNYTNVCVSVKLAAGSVCEQAVISKAFSVFIS